MVTKGGYVVLLLVMGLLLFGCVQPQVSGNVTEKDAKAFVNDDLRSKYPDAEIKEITETTLSEGSYQIKARITYNYSTPCPVRLNAYYDYPKKGFVASPPEYVTRDCTVCKDFAKASCILGTPEEAIIASHTVAVNDAVKGYLVAHPDAKPDAKFYTEYIDKGTKYRDVWVVRWLSPTTNFGIFVIISQRGPEALTSWEVARSEMV